MTAKEFLNQYRAAKRVVRGCEDVAEKAKCEMRGTEDEQRAINEVFKNPDALQSRQAKAEMLRGAD